MASITGSANQEFWLTRARAVARRVNLAWWLETLTAPALITGMAVAVAILIVRREIPHLTLWQLIAAAAAAFILVAIACLARASRRFESPEQSLVRIEASMRLRNALSAARAGVAPWPEPISPIDAGLKWHWPRIIMPLAGAMALLVAGISLPIPHSLASHAATPEEPQSWKQIDSELDQLAKEQVVDEPYLEEVKKRIEELRSQQEEQWFSHSSLEATDSLTQSHRSETRRMERELDRARNALNNLAQRAAGANEAERNRMMEEFNQALQGLQNGAMKPNPKLLEQLKSLDLENPGALNPEQLQQLRENLEKHQQAMKDAQAGEAGEDWAEELLADGQDGQEGDGAGEGDGPDKEGPGNGGIDRGPGHDPNVLGRPRDPLAADKLSGIQSKDLSRALPGDLLELQDGEHSPDTSPSTLSQGGTTDSTGKGGDRVWRDSLDPAEQKTLKRFFE